MAVVWLNGSLIEEDQAVLPALDRGVVWGYGLFETLRSYAGRLWAFDGHMERMEAGSAFLEVPVPARSEIRGAMEAALEANDLADAGVRVTVTRGRGPADPHGEPVGRPNVLVTAWPLRDYTALYEKGTALVSFADGGRALPGIKTTSYAASVAGRLHARRAGCDDALFVGPGDTALEATGANLMALNGLDLATPPVAEGVLPGVTRRTVLEVAVRAGLRPVERPLALEDLFSADEVLLTSSLREVYPARSLDGRPFRMGPQAALLREAFHRHVRDALGL